MLFEILIYFWLIPTCFNYIAHRLFLKNLQQEIIYILPVLNIFCTLIFIVKIIEKGYFKIKDVFYKK